MKTMQKIVVAAMLFLPAVSFAKAKEATENHSRTLSSEAQSKTDSQCQVEIKKEKKNSIYAASEECQDWDDNRRIIPKGLDRMQHLNLEHI